MAELEDGTAIGGHTAFHSGLTDFAFGGTVPVNIEGNEMTIEGDLRVGDISFSDPNTLKVNALQYLYKNTKTVSTFSNTDTTSVMLPSGSPSGNTAAIYSDGYIAQRASGSGTSFKMDIFPGSALDLTKFTDADSSSSDNDFMVFLAAYYLVSGRSYVFSVRCAAALSDFGVNDFYTTTPVSGNDSYAYRTLNLKKSAFTKTGSPVWSNIGVLRVGFEDQGGNSVALDIHGIFLIRKDQNQDIPNPFQHLDNNNQYVNDFECTSGTWVAAIKSNKYAGQYATLLAYGDKNQVCECVSSRTFSQDFTITAALNASRFNVLGEGQFFFGAYYDPNNSITFSIQLTNNISNGDDYLDPYSANLCIKEDGVTTTYSDSFRYATDTTLSVKIEKNGGRVDFFVSGRTDQIMCGLAGTTNLKGIWRLILSDTTSLSSGGGSKKIGVEHVTVSRIGTVAFAQECYSAKTVNGAKIGDLFTCVASLSDILVNANSSVTRNFATDPSTYLGPFILRASAKTGSVGIPVNLGVEGVASAVNIYIKSGYSAPSGAIIVNYPPVVVIQNNTTSNRTVDLKIYAINVDLFK